MSFQNSTLIRPCLIFRKLFPGKRYLISYGIKADIHTNIDNAGHICTKVSSLKVNEEILLVLVIFHFMLHKIASFKL